jgi:hypothetical protein
MLELVAHQAPLTWSRQLTDQILVEIPGLEVQVELLHEVVAQELHMLTTLRPNIPSVKMEDPVVEALKTLLLLLPPLTTLVEYRRKHPVDPEPVMEIMVVAADLVRVRSLVVVVAVPVVSAVPVEQRLVVMAEAEQMYFQLG